MPTTFQQLVNMVITETNRPDLVAETQQAVWEATLSVHCSEYFYNDIITAQVNFNTADYIQQLATSSFVNFRNLAYFRKAVPGPTLFQPMSGSANDPPVEGVDPLTGNPVPSTYVWPWNEYVYLTEVSPDYILDDWGFEKQDIWYTVGGQICIKSSTSFQTGQFGYYAFPTLDIANGGAGYQSWIANNFPYAIVYRAAGTLFQKIGQDSAIAAYMGPPGRPGTGLAGEQLQILKLSSIIGTGR